MHWPTMQIYDSLNKQLYQFLISSDVQYWTVHKKCLQNASVCPYLYLNICSEIFHDIYHNISFL